MSVKTLEEYIKEEEIPLYQTDDNKKQIILDDINDIKLMLDQLNIFSETLKNSVGSSSEPNVRVRLLVHRTINDLRQALHNLKGAHIASMNQLHSERQ